MRHISADSNANPTRSTRLILSLPGTNRFGVGRGADLQAHENGGRDGKLRGRPHVEKRQNPRSCLHVQAFRSRAAGVEREERLGF